MRSVNCCCSDLIRCVDQKAITLRIRKPNFVQRNAGVVTRKVCECGAPLKRQRTSMERCPQFYQTFPNCVSRTAIEHSLWLCFFRFSNKVCRGRSEDFWVYGIA